MTVLRETLTARFLLIRDDEQLVCNDCNTKIVEGMDAWVVIREGISGRPTVFWVRCSTCQDKLEG